MTAPASLCEPCVILVFGATGDLARRKIFPALLALHRRGFLHARTPVVAVSRRPTSVADLLAGLQPEDGGGDAQALHAFAASVRCIVFDHTEATLPAFVAAVDDVARERGAGAARAVYFALPADAFEPTAALATTSRPRANSTRRSRATSTSLRSTGSTTTWARSWCAT